MFVGIAGFEALIESALRQAPAGGRPAPRTRRGDSRLVPKHASPGKGGRRPTWCSATRSTDRKRHQRPPAPLDPPLAPVTVPSPPGTEPPLAEEPMPQAALVRAVTSATYRHDVAPRMCAILLAVVGKGSRPGAHVRLLGAIVIGIALTAGPALAEEPAKPSPSFMDVVKESLVGDVYATPSRRQPLSAGHLRAPGSIQETAR